jgi:AraC-like DNA-binding protein
MQARRKTHRDHRRRSLYENRDEWHGVPSMNALRELRRSADLGQRELAALLSVPLETRRTWDSGRRPVPIAVIHRAAEAVERHNRQQQLLSLDQLAKELGVHIRTLQAHFIPAVTVTAVVAP